MSYQYRPDYTPHPYQPQPQPPSDPYQLGPISTYEHPPSHISNHTWSRPQDAYPQPSVLINQPQKVNDHHSSRIAESPLAQSQDTYHPRSHIYDDPLHQHHKHGAQNKAGKKEKMVEKNKAETPNNRDEAWRNEVLKSLEKNKAKATGKKTKKERKAEQKLEQEKLSKAWGEEMNKQDEEWVTFIRGGIHGGRTYPGNTTAKKESEDTNWEKDKAEAVFQADQDMRAGPADKGKCFKKFWKKKKGRS